MSIFPAMCTQQGMAFATPDVCITPAAPSPVPVPYPNSGSCADGVGTSKVKIVGAHALRKGDKFTLSTGDDAGTAPGGNVSGVFKNQVEVKMGDPKVKADNGELAYHSVPTGHNGVSANMPAGAHITPCQMKVKVKGVGMSFTPGDTNFNNNNALVDHHCPSPNFASESTDGLNQAAANGDTNAQAVQNWLNTNDGRGAAAYNGILGADGGGGFLSAAAGGTLRVIQLTGPMTLFRVCGGGAAPFGGWWTTSPCANPVTEAALPGNNLATNLQTVNLPAGQTIEVLAGAGAPRCSNLPGGPEQIYVKYGTCNPANGIVTAGTNTPI